MVMEVTEEVDLKSNEDDIIAALKKYSVLCPDDEDRGVNEARAVLCKPEDPAGDTICGDSVASCSAEGKDIRISQSHSKKVIKHALRQQAKRRRKNTTIASGSSEHVLVKSAGLDTGHVTPCPAPQPTQPRPGMATMREVLASIPGFSVKPRRRSSKKLSTAAQLEQTKEGCVDLETPDSILAGTNLRLLLNKHTFSALPPLYQYKLVQLLPAVDQADMSLRLSSSGLNNEFFARACLEWNERLSEGEFTPENQQRLKAEAEREMSRLDPWKLKHFEPIWGERHESYTFDGSSCAEGDRLALKSGMKLRASAAAGRPAPRARTVGAVTRAITSCRDEPPPPATRHKRHAEHVEEEHTKKPKSEAYAEPVATTAWGGRDALDAVEDDPFAPPDRFNDSDHSAYEPTVEHADDVIHESAILRPPVFSVGLDAPTLKEARLLGPGQNADETLDVAEKWTDREESESVSETRQTAVWTNQDEDERISAVPKEWSLSECRSVVSDRAGPSKVSEHLMQKELVMPEVVDKLQSGVKDCGATKGLAVICGPMQTKLEDFKMVQSKLAEFEAAQTKLAELEIAQAKLAEFNAAQAKLVEFKAAQAKLVEFEVAQTKLAEFKAAQTKLAEFEAAQTKLAEFEAAQTKLAEFEATQTKLAEFEATQTELQEFKAVQTKLVEFEAAQTKRMEFESAQTKLVDSEAAQTKLAELEAAQTKLVEFEGAQTKLAELEAAQTKLADLEAAQTKLAEFEAAQTKLADFEAAQTKLAELEAAQTKLAELEAAQTKLAELEAAQTKLAELEAAQTKLAEFEAAQTKLAEFEAAQTKLAEFEAAQTKLAELEAAQTKLAEFEAAQTKLAEFEAAQTKLAEFEAAQTKLAELEATQTKLAELEAAQTKLAEFEEAQTKLVEFEATQTKLVGLDAAQASVLEYESKHGRYSESEQQLSRPPFEVTQTRLVEFSSEEMENLDTSQSTSEGFQTPELSGGVMDAESKTSDNDESQDKLVDFEQTQLDEFNQSQEPPTNFGQIKGICEDYSQKSAAGEDFSHSNAVTENYNLTNEEPVDYIQSQELGENQQQLEGLVQPGSHLEHFKNQDSNLGNKLGGRLANSSQSSTSGEINNSGPDCLNESANKQDDLIGSSEIIENFKEEPEKYELYEQSAVNTEDCTQTLSEIKDLNRSQSDLASVSQLSEKADVFSSTVNLVAFKLEKNIEDFSQSGSNVDEFCQPESNSGGFSETSTNVDELGQPRINAEGYSQSPSNIEVFSQQTTNTQTCNLPRTDESGFSNTEDDMKVFIQPSGNIDGFNQICDVAVEQYDGSAEVEAALRLAVSREWETKCVGDVKVIPMHEELEVRLEEGSFPVERDLNSMNWYPVAADGRGAGNATGETATGEAYSSGQALKLELEVTLTPEASTMGGPSTSVIPPTTIVCLPSLVVNSPHLVTPGGGCGRPASSSAVPYLALSGATPLRALTQLHKPAAGVPTVGGKQKPPRDPAQGTAPSGRNSRGVSNRPPPGAVNLERSYQICQAVIQNSPNRDQLRAQLKPPPPLLTGPKRPGPTGPPHPGLVTGTKGVRALPLPGPRATAPTPSRNALYERPLRLPSPPPPPPGIGAGVVRHVFTSAHGIPVTMAVLPQGSGTGPQEVTIAQDAMGGGGQYILVHRGGEPDMQLAGRRNPGPPRASSAPPANRNVGAGGVRPMGGRGRPASVDVRQEYVCPPERYLVACPSPGTQAISRRRDVSQHGMSYADVGDAAAPGRPDLSTAPRPAPRPSFGTASGAGFAAQCGCNARPMVVCRKCGAFCHDDCVSPASICDRYPIPVPKPHNTIRSANDN